MCTGATRYCALVQCQVDLHSMLQGEALLPGTWLVDPCATRYCTLAQCQVDACSQQEEALLAFLQHACLTACGTCNVDTIHPIGITLLCGTHLQGIAYCLQGEPQSAVQELALICTTHTLLYSLQSALQNT